MQAVDIAFNAVDSSMALTIVPDPAVPEEVALMGCAYAILMTFPDDQATAAKYIYGVFRVFGFGVIQAPASKDEIIANSQVMDAIRSASPEIANKLLAA
jgi:hypothetical protein